MTDGPGPRETKKEPRGKLQTSRYLHVKTPPQLLVKIEKTHWGWPSILQISASCLCICSVLCDLLCRKNASLLGRRGQICPASLLRNSHPKEAIEAIGHPHLEVVEGHSRLEEGGVSQNPRLPKIPRIPATSVWDLRNLGGYPGFKGFWSSNSDLELQSGIRTRPKLCFCCGFSTIQTSLQTTSISSQIILDNVSSTSNSYNQQFLCWSYSYSSQKYKHIHKPSTSLQLKGAHISPITFILLSKVQNTIHKKRQERWNGYVVDTCWSIGSASLSTIPGNRT